MALSYKLCSRPHFLDLAMCRWSQSQKISMGAVLSKGMMHGRPQGMTNEGTMAA